MRLSNVSAIMLVFVLVLLSSCAQYGQQTQIATTNPASTASATYESNPASQGAAQKGQQAVKEFEIIAKQFQFNPATIEVNKGDKVRLIVTSIDVPHGFSITEYGINERLDPGKPVTIEFTADKQGTFTAFCSVLCGSGHLGMKGELIVK
ncbi:cupredoxin domain-containing protein [Candidatus Woesearchaeota archaeon]|nr:cupredoxin domain-containing protein [Candidatus Woesearchaeota archaeon]